MDRPLTVHEVLEQELQALGGERPRAGGIFGALHRQRLRALCLSGGGIRSATFALGVIQGLARKGLLDQFDYLSTVSGGGFTGGWLSSWIARASLPAVIAQLRQQPADALQVEPGPIRHLRSYSNYLTPRLGILSADAWTLAATYVRNLFLNWLAFVPPLIALLSLPLLLVQLVSWQPLGVVVVVQYGFGLALAAMATAGIIAAVRYVHLNRPRQQGSTEGTGVIDEKRNQRDFLRQCLLPMVAAVTAASICWAWGTSYASPIGDVFRQWPAWQLLGAAGAAMHFTGWALAHAAMPRRPVPGVVRVRHALLILVTGFGVGIVASALAKFAPPLWDLTQPERGTYVLLATPLLLSVVLVCSHLYVGYTSAHQSDAEREWSARFTGWVFITIAIWLIAAGLALFGPAILRDAIQLLTTQHVLSIQWLLAVVGGTTGIGAVVAARNTAAAAKTGSRLGTRLALGLAGVFIAWLVIVLSWTGGTLIALVHRMAGSPGPGSTRGLLIAIGVLGALFLFGLISSRLIDTNMFSLHAMYRARLIRAYLGASRPDGSRDPNRFTGFDDGDNLHLRDLWPRPAPAGGNQRLLHVINATLNLAAGENLAWQERKAESFTFSALHCGSMNVGYRATQDDPGDANSGGYAGERGISLGTAMAISGAAASPEMGYHSSPVLSLLLAFFNVRLGWWLGNPGPAGQPVYHRSSPRLSLTPILDEALGRTDDHNKYVYLSDGGHFENLGIYEMVLRRCHVIVVCDATTDGGDLGNAIRKIRIDLGIPIDMEGGGGREASLDAALCTLGRIRYGCVDPGAPDGVLVHIRPAIGADAPSDVVAYARANPGFPHEPTIDQWFTESQFESYRQLGSHIIETIVAADPPVEGATMSWFVKQARENRRSC